MLEHYKGWWREELEKEGWRSGAVPLYSVEALVYLAERRTRTKVILQTKEVIADYLLRKQQGYLQGDSRLPVIQAIAAVILTKLTDME